jgi:pimeloyl-ACP methyl ester carboxylesterase
MDVRKIKTGPGLEFDCSVAGLPDNSLVLLLHGFGVSRHFWDRQVAGLG